MFALVGLRARYGIVNSNTGNCLFNVLDSVFSSVSEYTMKLSFRKSSCFWFSTLPMDFGLGFEGPEFNRLINCIVLVYFTQVIEDRLLRVVAE